MDRQLPAVANFEMSPEEAQVFFKDQKKLLSLVQPAIISKGTEYAVHTTVFLQHPTADEDHVKNAVSSLVDEIVEVKKRHGDATTALEAVVGISTELTQKWIAGVQPKEMKTFAEKKFGGGERKGQISFPATGGDIFLLVKGSRLDLCYELTKRTVQKMKKSHGVQRVKSVNCFKYLLGQDLTGFADGTRNPSIQGVALSTAVIPSDEDEANAGGSYLFHGLFVHDLEKFELLDKMHRDHTIGREHAQLRVQQRTHYLDIYNPRLEDVHLAAAAKPGDAVPPHVLRYHINRGYGVMLRQAWPWGTVEESGLSFCAFSLSLKQLDEALDRMSGVTVLNYVPGLYSDGVVDALMDITRATTGQFYYCPTVKQLAALAGKK